MNKIILIITVFAFSCAKVNAQHVSFSAASDFAVVNRNIAVEKSEGKTWLHVDAAEGAGVAWIKNVKFTAGTIEFDVKGKDVKQQSFVGIAFHGANDSMYDCVYFRPFNFNATDPVAKNHAVQYISMPQYDWFYLRQKFPNRYENKLTEPIDAGSWFHAKVVVTADEIKVFVNGNNQPSLTVTPLHNYSKGQIGFWVGNGSDGDFSNLTIKQK